MGVLLVIGLLTLGIFYVVKMLGGTEDKKTYSVEATTSEWEKEIASKSYETDVPHTEKEVLIKPQPKQYAEVYLFVPKGAVVKCAHCDGENPIGTKICRICGCETDA